MTTPMDPKSFMREGGTKGKGGAFLRRFKDPVTKIRLFDKVEDTYQGLEGKPDGWFPWHRHWDEDVNRPIPCMANLGDCHGCKHPNAKVRETDQMYSFRAFNHEGYLNVYQVGPTLKEEFESKAKWGDIYAMDLNVKRWKNESGRWRFEVEPAGTAADISGYDGPVPDVGEVIMRAYKEYEDEFAGGTGEEHLGAPDAAHDEPMEGVGKPRDTTAPAAEASTSEDPQTWPLSQLRDYLDSAGIEYPKNGLRPKLLPLVQAHQAELAKETGSDEAQSGWGKEEPPF